MTPTIGKSILRFKGAERCPICGGADDDPRGEGQRCHGFLSGNRKAVFCSRDEFAGNAPFDPKSNCYRHWAKGPCQCGVEHAPADLKLARKGKGKKSTLGDIDQVYQYQDPGRVCRFEVVRFKNPKDFRQRQPLGGGQYQWNLRGVRPFLYRLPELIAADPAKPAWIVEGEKDVDNLVAAGEVATCNPMGALKWRDHYSDFLKGRHAFILPDNDSDGSDHALQVAESLLGIAASVKIVHIPGLPEKGDVSDFLATGGTIDQLRELADKTEEWESMVTPSGNGKGNGKDKRPRIPVFFDEHKAVDEAVKALGAAPMLFQRGGSLVTILADCKPGKQKLQRPAGSLRIALLPVPQIRRLMGVHAIFTKERKGKDGPIVEPVPPPPAIVDQVATLGMWEGIRPIEGITETPTLRPDGSLIDQPGYDEETGLWFAPSCEFPPIPEQPTLRDAMDAVDILYHVVCDFPFASGIHKAAWLAALLTPLARWAIDGACPLFLFDANCPGTGKSKLCDIIAILLTGREMARGDYPSDNDEMQKMLLSVAIAGDPMLLFDNVTTGWSIGGSAIDRALTARTIKGRILGQSKMTSELLINLVFFATGNNLGVRGDALRRIVLCGLETTDERPEERRGFKITGDLLAFVKHNRGRLVAAALTILRGYIAAGKPDQSLTPMDYPAWCGLVRNAVRWATLIDPCEGRKELREKDEDTSAAKGLLEAWKNLCESENETALTAAAALKILNDPHNQDKYAELRAILLEWSKDHKLPSSGTIGNKFKKISRRIIDGKRLEFRPYAGNREWFVKVACNGPSGGSGGSGGSVPPVNPDAGVNDTHTPSANGIAYGAWGGAGKPEPPASPEPPTGPGAYGQVNWHDLDPTPF